MTQQELEKLVSNSFLRNVPEIMVSEGCSMDEAMRRAYDRDEKMLIQFTGYPGERKDWVEEFTREMSDRVWRRINAESPQRS